MMRWNRLAEYEDLPDGWDLVPFTTIASVTAGQSPSSEYYNGRGEGIPFLQGNADFGVEFPKAIVWCTQPAKIANPGSTLVSVRAPVGELNRADRVYAIGRGLASLEPTTINPDFLYYGMHLWRKCLQRAGQGSTFDAVTSRHFRQLLIARPKDVIEQETIAAALRTTDDAIAATRRELDATRRLKQALMQQLFTRGVPGRHHEFVDGKWLSYPESWRIQRLGEIAAITSGFTMGRDLSGCEITTVPYLTVRNVQNGYFDFSDVVETEIKLSEVDGNTLQYGDILVTEGGDRDKLGRGGMWREQIHPCAFQNHIFRVRLAPNTYRPELLHYLLQDYRTKRYFYAHAKQTSNLCTINSRELKKFPVAIPGWDEQEEMLAILDAIEQQMSGQQNELDALHTLKRSLLQNLLTGRVRVAMEEAA